MGGLFGVANVANHTRALAAAETVAGSGRSLPKRELAPARFEEARDDDLPIIEDEARKREIEILMRTDRPRYFRDEAMQREYLEILEREEARQQGGERKPLAPGADVGIPVNRSTVDQQRRDRVGALTETQSDPHARDLAVDQSLLSLDPEGLLYLDAADGERIADSRILSDVTPDNEWIPGAQYATSRGRTGPISPGLDAQLSALQYQARTIIRQVREYDPTWNVTPGVTSPNPKPQARISAVQGQIREAEARLNDLVRTGIAPGPLRPGPLQVPRSGGRTDEQRIPEGLRGRPKPESWRPPPEAPPPSTPEATGVASVVKPHTLQELRDVLSRLGTDDSSAPFDRSWIEEGKVPLEKLPSYIRDVSKKLEESPGENASSRFVFPLPPVTPELANKIRRVDSELATVAERSLRISNEVIDKLYLNNPLEGDRLLSALPELLTKSDVYADPRSEKPRALIIHPYKTRNDTGGSSVAILEVSLSKEAAEIVTIHFMPEYTFKKILNEIKMRGTGATGGTGGR